MMRYLFPIVIPLFPMLLFCVFFFSASMWQEIKRMMK